MGDEIIERLEKLESKISILEETSNTIKNIGISERAKEYIEQQQYYLSAANFMNSISESSQLETKTHKDEINRITREKNLAEEQIKTAIDKAHKQIHYSENVYDLFDYEQNEDNTLTITSIKSFDLPNDFVVPNEIKGIPVTAIGDSAFANTSIKEVVISEGITNIGKDAFSKCCNLINIKLPNSLTKISEYAFQDCKALEKIEIPPNIINWERSFCSCGLKSVLIAKGITNIPNAAFQDCKELSDVVLPNGLVCIENTAFCRCSKLKRIVIPSTVRFIKEGAFCDGIIDHWNHAMDIAILGNPTQMLGINNRKFITLYCRPDSSVLQYARENNIKVRPLQEFNI